MKTLKYILIGIIIFTGSYVSAKVITSVQIKNGDVVRMENDELIWNHINLYKVTDNKNTCYITQTKTSEVVTGLSISCLK